MKLLKSFIAVLLISTALFAQDGKVIGKIFPADQADILFGNVIQSQVVDRTDMESYMAECDNYMMCGFIEGQLVITNDYRKVLTPFSLQVADNNSNVPNDYIISESDVLNLYSKCRFEELLQKSDNTTIQFEERGEVMVITYGAFALEFGVGCPPMCP